VPEPVSTPARSRVDAVRGLWVLAAACCGCWPLGPFLVDRWFRWEGMWMNGLLLGGAVAAWGWLACEGGHARRVCSPPWLAGAAGLFLLHAGTHAYTPRLLGHGVAAFGVVCVMVGLLPTRRRAGSWGLVPLVLFSLPVMPSVQYVFGYPLRVAVAKLASLWLGGEIRAVGTGLSDGVRTVFVDAPCSGLRMLSIGLILASASAVAVQLRPWRTCLLLVAAVCSTLLGNACRAVALFVLEVRAPGGIPHSVVGLVLFSFCAGLVIWAALGLKRTQKREASPVSTRSPGPVLSAGFLLACVAVGVVPILSGASATPAAPAQPLHDWPVSWNGSPLKRMPVNPALGEFLRDFPGRMAEFQVVHTGQRMFLRWTPVPTRMLHTAEGCYRAMGGRVSPLPAVKDRHGHTWSRFSVGWQDGGETVVRQCYFAVERRPSTRKLEERVAGARSWPDASSWYWGAAGPLSSVEATLAVTVTER